MNEAERIATAHHLLIGAEQAAIDTGRALPAEVSNALDVLEADMPIVPAYTYRATGTRVVDGDTFIAAVDLGFRVSYSCIVRLHGVNTPEKGKDGAARAKATLEGLVLNRRILLSSFKDERSFERWICDVWNVEGATPMNVAQQLISKGLGKPFEKGDKWTR